MRDKIYTKICAKIKTSIKTKIRTKIFTKVNTWNPITIQVEFTCITTSTVTKINTKLGAVSGNESFLNTKSAKIGCHLQNTSTKFSKVCLNAMNFTHLILS